MDVIVSCQPRPQSEEFRVWKLAANAENGAIITCTDENDKVLKQQRIPFTDFEPESNFLGGRPGDSVAF
jgi:hypothetical protein